MKKTVLVTGAGGSAGYNFIHSLLIADENITVIGVDTNKEHLALSNAHYKYLVPPSSKELLYIEALNQIIKKHKVNLVHPQPDPEVAFISHHRNKINAKTYLPSQETIETCQNKIAAIDAFKRSEVLVAESYVIENKNDLVKSFEILKKKQNKIWVRAIRGAGSKAALPVTEIQHAEFWIDYWHKNKNLGYGDFMVSEFLPGKEFAFQSLWKDGKVLVSQARERKEYVFGNLTPSGQSSSPSVAVTVHRQDVNEIAEKAVLAVDKSATGIFCVDIKENNENQPCVIEINPGRFFTTSNFFSVAGCNMPYYYVKLALGEELPKLKKFDALKKDLYWLRLIDMGCKLIDSDWGVDETYAK